MAGGLGRLVIKEEVLLVMWFLWGEVVVWLLLLEEVLLVMSLLLLDLAEADIRELAGEVASLQEEEGEEEQGEEGEGCSGLAIGFHHQ